MSDCRPRGPYVSRWHRPELLENIANLWYTVSYSRIEALYEHRLLCIVKVPRVLVSAPIWMQIVHLRFADALWLPPTIWAQGHYRWIGFWLTDPSGVLSQDAVRRGSGVLRRERSG